MNLSNIVLNTGDEKKLSNYISELFDKQVDIFNDQYSINMGGINLIFKKSDGTKGEKDSKHTLLEFSVASLQELEDLLKKVQFYHYRLNSGKDHDQFFDIPEIHGNQNIHYFEVEDTDNRKWKFSTYIQ